jgi:hypothetical protein
MKSSSPTNNSIGLLPEPPGLRPGPGGGRLTYDDEMGLSTYSTFSDASRAHVSRQTNRIPKKTLSYTVFFIRF